MNIQKTHFDLPIWRVMPDHARTSLAIELRSRENKIVRFLYLDLNKKTQIPIHIDSEWWKGLLEVHNGIVLLHGYENPGLPVHQGIFAYNMEKEEPAWQMDLARYEALTEDTVKTTEHTGETKYYSLSTGEKLEQPPDAEAFASFNKEKNDTLLFPKVIIDGHERFLHHYQEINKAWGIKPELHIDFLEYQNHRVFNFYHKNKEGKWNQELGILTKGKSTLHCRTGENLKGLSLDPFFIFQGYLIWIEGVNCLSCLRLFE